LRKRGIFVSPSGVRCVWLRHQLGRFKDHLKALEEKNGTGSSDPHRGAGRSS
jgi:hypothetical protein